MRWTHPLRGEVPAGEFLGIAETTGLATQLSCAVLAGLREDFAAMAGVELVVIDAETRLRPFRQELRWNEACYGLHDIFSVQ